MRVEIGKTCSQVERKRQFCLLLLKAGPTGTQGLTSLILYAIEGWRLQNPSGHLLQGWITPAVELFLLILSWNFSHFQEMLATPVPSQCTLGVLCIFQLGCFGKDVSCTLLLEVFWELLKTLH